MIIKNTTHKELKNKTIKDVSFCILYTEMLDNIIIIQSLLFVRFIILFIGQF